MAADWQSLLSAPRDGSDVLLGFARRRPMVAYRGDSYWICSETDEEVEAQPIAWQSISDPVPLQFREPTDGDTNGR